MKKELYLKKIPLDTIEFSSIHFQFLKFSKVLRFGSDFNILPLVYNGGISPDQKW
jgi:hypothetical protein